MVLYEADSYEIRHRVQLQSSDPYLAKIRKYWEGALREATNNMPTPEWNRVSIDAEPDFLRKFASLSSFADIYALFFTSN